MIIEYDVLCFERTLTIKFDDKYEHLKETISELVDRLYTLWQNIDSDSCLEEFIMDHLYEMGYECKEWDSIPYGDDYEPRETLWVCDHCLMGIECHEGNQVTLTHGVDSTDALDSRCGWCKECGFDTLYELV